MKVKMIIEVTEKEMNNVINDIKEYNLSTTPRELILERVETDLYDYIDMSALDVKVV